MATAKKAPAKIAAPNKEALPIDTTKPAIFGAMASVMDQVGAIGKDSANKQQGWKFRGIDAAYNAIHPLLALNRIITVPRVTGLISRMTVPTKNGGTMNYTMLSVEYDFVCTIDGSKITVGPIYGEGMDSADKSTAKALAVGHKYAIFQTWCIPTSDMPDGDAETPDVVMPVGLMPMAPQPAGLLPQQPANPVAPDTMPQPPAVDVLMPPQPATGVLMPQVAVNTAATVAIPSPPATRKPVHAGQNVSPPMDDANLVDTIMIEDEPAAQMAADMLINLADMHKDTLYSLQDFWHKNQIVLKILNQSFPSQYKRVADTFAGYKSALQQPTQEST